MMMLDEFKLLNFLIIYWFNFVKIGDLNRGVLVIL